MKRLSVIMGVLCLSMLVGVPAKAVSITLHWTTPGDDSTSGTAAQYDLRFSTSPITDSTWDTATRVGNEPVPQLSGTQESCTVSGLLGGTTYYFAIKTADEIPNWSGLSNVVVCVTPDTDPPKDVTDLRCP